MSTTIDSLQIEIQSNSTNAAGGIDSLAKALKKLNKNGDVSDAISNLNNLRKSLHAFASVPSSASKIESLANALKSLKKVGPIDLGSSLDSVKKAMESLKDINTDDVAPHIERIADALTPLNNVKGGGFNAMMNGLKKLDEVTDGLDSATIDRFVAKIKELDEKLGPVSQKLVAIGNAFKGASSKAIEASGGFSVFGGKVNTTTLNLQSMIDVAKNVWAALQPVINLLKNVIGQAIEWDGIAERFGRGFGENAEEVYSWIRLLNKEMGINVQQFMQYSSVYATMLTGFGVAAKDATQMALGYSELTYDIWAGYNDIYKNFSDAAEAVKSAIAGEVEPIRRAGFTIVEATLEQTAANHGLEISLEKATEAQKSYLRYLTLVDQAHAQNLVGTYAKEMNTAEGLMRTFAQQLKSLAQTFGSVFLPVLVKVMPWLQAFIDLVGDAIVAVSAFFGIDIQKVDPDSWGSLDGMGESANSATESVGKTTEALKELKNATLGIDELNVISPSSKSSSSGGTAGSGPNGFDGLDVDSLWNKSIFDEIQFEVDAIKEQLKEALAGIEAAVSGFALAIGAILVLCANPATIALGIGLLAVGAVGLAHAISANWDGMSERLAETLTTVTATVSGFLLALGAMLTFTGTAPGLGIGMMIAGAASLGTAVAINWNFLEGDLKNTLSILTAIVSGGTLALGAVLAFSGAKIGLGIALMAAGAAGLVTAAALNWDSLSEPVRKALGVIGAIAGSSLLAIGLIICLTGGALPIGIGLMVAGATTLASSVALNWDSLTGNLRNSVATITAIVSGALLGIGAVFAFSGAGLPLGIGMMLVGAAGLVATAPINWSSLADKIKNITKEIGIAVGASFIALGALLAFTGVALPIGIALIATGAVSLVSGVALNWDYIVNSIMGVLKDIGIAIGGAMLAIGVILCLSGVGIPLGIALIAAGVSSMVAGVALNWDTFKDIGKRCVDGVVSGFSTLGDKVKDIFGKFVQTIKNFLGIKSPSKVFSEIGGYCMQGLTNALSPSGIKDKISSMWSNAKSWWDKSKAKLASYTPSIGSIKDKLSSAWTTTKNWWNKSKAALAAYTPSIGSIKDKLSSAWNTAKTWWSKNVKLSIPSLSFKVTYSTKGLNAIQKSIVKVLGLSGWPKLSFAANGGIFDTGSLVWAGESGPEILANAGGGRTGVMNVEQMQSAVYEGVYSAVMTAMRNGGGNGGNIEVVVNLDGRRVAANVEKHQRERGASLMGSQVYEY